MNASQLKRLKELEEENLKLKEMYAESSLHNLALKDLIEKKAFTPAQKMDCTAYLKEKHTISTRQACILLNLSTSDLYYKLKPKCYAPVIDKLSHLAKRRPTYGFWKMYDMILIDNGPEFTSYLFVELAKNKAQEQTVKNILLCTEEKC